MPFNKSYIQESGHGGFCCGMTHIFNFPPMPTSVLNERVAKDKAERTAFIRDYPYQAQVLNDSYPQQTAAERLTQMVASIENGIPNVRGARPLGIIDIVLTDEQCDFWRDTIEALGFKEVGSNENSNSSNTIRVFHRNSGGK